MGIVGDKNRPCRLCGQDKPLQASHIIPEFLYKPLYEKFGPRKIFLESTDPDEAEKTEQKGLREWLLCSACEQRFSVWEAIAHKFYFGNLAGKPMLVNGYLIFSGLPYSPLKNFWNSILWRLGVTKIEAHEGVFLGDDEHILRDLLLRGDPGDPSQYGCFLVGLRFIGKHRPGLLLKPSMVTQNGRMSAQIVMNCIQHFFNLSKLPLDDPFHKVVLQRDGALMMMTEDIENIAGLTNGIKRMGQAIRIRDAKKTKRL